MKRIYIIGTTGSGKTYLANSLSKHHNISHYDLDDIFWIKKGKNHHDVKRDAKERNKLLKNVVKKKRWIIEGSYSSWVEEAIKKSEFVIWLNPSFFVIAPRLIIRHIQRKMQGKKEKFSDLIALLKYAKNYHKEKQNTGYFHHKEFIEKHKLNFIYIKDKKEMNKFLKDTKRDN